MRLKNLAREVLDKCICFHLGNQFSESAAENTLDNIQTWYRFFSSLTTIILFIIYSSIKWENSGLFRRFLFGHCDRGEGGRRNSLPLYIRHWFHSLFHTSSISCTFLGIFFPNFYCSTLPFIQCPKCLEQNTK